ncbi:MAG: pitrilysin family protein [Steroidobacteraceae bacterium]
MSRLAALRRLACAALVALAGLDGAMAAAPATEKVAEVEGITEYRLANGLRVLLFPDQSKPTITVNMTYLVGSRHESYGETGMAHLLEHMLFKGTRNRADVAKEFNARGARFNGTTSLDRTNYYELLQASDQNLDWALGMEADRMVNSLIARKDLDTEMTVVRNEYESGENSPTAVLFKRLQSIAYDWHNYGNSTIGNRSDIENVDIAHLQSFYRTYYQPDNAVLLVAGKFDAAKTLQLVAKYFGAIPRPARALPKLWTVEPTQDGERSVVVRRVGDLQVVILGYRVPSVLHADAQALDYAGQVLGNAPSGRLHKALVETGKAANVSAGLQEGLDGSLFVAMAIVKKGDPVEPVRDEMISIVENFVSNPPVAAEMERARIQMANANERTMTNHESIGLALSEYIALGDWRTFFLQRDEGQKVTAEQVQAASRKYLLRDNRSVGLFLPEDNPRRADIPQAASAAALVKNYTPKAVVADAETFDPSPENIERRVRRLEIAGMKVALLSKKNRGETVVFSMSLPAGDEKTLFGQSETGSLTGAMMSMGTTRYTRAQLRDEFAKLKVSGGVRGQGASFQTTRSNLVAAIALTAHVLREPTFPADEFEQLRKLMITSIESQLSDPQARAGEAAGRQFNIYPKGDPRYASTMQEAIDNIKAVTLDDLKRFHKTFYAANRAQFSIVGDFDEAEVIKAIEGGFANWRNDTPWKRITREYRDIPAKSISIETPDKENAMLIARINLDVNQNDPDYAALFLADYILGAGAGFDSRLMARIRVKEGLSYGVNSQVAGSIFDRAGGWTAQAIAAPQNMAKVEAALREELAKALKDGFTDEEVAKAKSGFVQQFAQNRVQDQSLASRLLSHLDSGRTLLTWDKAFEARVMAVTPEAARAALRKFLDPAKLTVVKAGDFAKAAKTP